MVLGQWLADRYSPQGPRTPHPESATRNASLPVDRTETGRILADTSFAVEEPVMKVSVPQYVALLACVLGLAQLRADEPTRLRESLPIGSRYQVQIRVQLQGTLIVPAEK